jgi:hypothetical protein
MKDEGGTRRKERELNPQGSSLARFRIGCRRQSACPSVSGICWRLNLDRSIRAPAGGVEPPIVALTGRRLTVRPHRYRGLPLTAEECPAGVEPALPPWQGSRLPLQHGHMTASELSMKQQRAPGGTRRITGAESSPLNDQCNRLIGTRGARTLTRLVKSQGLCH